MTVYEFIKLEVAERREDRRRRRRALDNREARIGVALYLCDYKRGLQAGIVRGTRRDWSDNDAWHRGYLDGRLIRRQIYGRMASYDTKA